MRPCIHRRWVDQHFAGRISAEDERAMRRHLPDCEDCRRLYRRMLISARLDPQALSAEERIGRGLGFVPSRSRRVWWASAMTTGVAVAACLVLFLMRSPHGGFVARGGRLGDGNELLVYRTQPGQRPHRLSDGARIHPEDELAFAYRNPEGFARLMVFAIDEHRHIYWYYPAWTDAKTDPVAVPVTASPSPIELPEAVKHALDGHQVRLHALFTNATISVKQMEQLVRKRHEDDDRGPSTRSLILNLDVAP